MPESLAITAWTQGRPLLPALRNSGRFVTIPLKMMSADERSNFLLQQDFFNVFKLFLRSDCALRILKSAWCWEQPTIIIKLKIVFFQNSTHEQLAKFAC